MLEPARFWASTSAALHQGPGEESVEKVRDAAADLQAGGRNAAQPLRAGAATAHVREPDIAAGASPYGIEEAAQPQVSNHHPGRLQGFSSGCFHCGHQEGL